MGRKGRRPPCQAAASPGPSSTRTRPHSSERRERPAELPDNVRSLKAASRGKPVFVGFGIGRSLGALLSTFIYVRLGFPAVTAVAVLFDLFGLLALAEMQGKISLLSHLIGRAKRGT